MSSREPGQNEDNGMNDQWGRDRDVETRPGEPSYDNAGHSVDPVASAGSPFGDSAFGGSMSPTEDGKGLGDRAKNAASEVTHKATEKVEARVEDRKDRAVGSLESVAQSLRTASNQLEDGDGVARYMSRAANQVDNLAAFLGNRDVSELFNEVEGFAQRQPAVFVGGAFALGVLGARFLKSSRSNLDRDAFAEPGTRDPRGRYAYESGQDRAPQDGLRWPVTGGYANPSHRDGVPGISGDRPGGPDTSW